MTSFGHFNSFDSSIESWTHYAERLQQFFIANDIANADRKRAIFLTVVGPSAYGLLRNLLSPAAPTSKTLEELIQALNNHYDPVPSEIVERFKFNSRVRQAGESVANFIAELRCLAKFCNYGTSLDMMLRDRLVCGIQDEAIQRKLLSETELTLARASEIAVMLEAAARDAVDLRIATGDVHQIRAKKSFAPENKNRKKPSTSVTNRKCYRCGDTRHGANDCKFKNASCFNCNKVGHLAKVCQSKEKSKNKDKVNQLQEIPNTCEVLKQYTLCNIRGLGEALPPVQVTCQVQGKPVIFEIDSGAPYTLMPSVMFKNFEAHFPPLEDTNIRLQSYTRHPIDILGVSNVNVRFQSKTENLPLLVVKQGSVCLAGRNWILPLGLMAVFESLNSHSSKLLVMNSSEKPSTKPTIKGLLEKYEVLFSPSLGLVKDVEVKFSVLPSVVPKFFKARPVPYALRDKLEAEINRLVSEGILEPVKNSEWAAPIVPVLKQDGQIRICGDFKLTVNKATELEQYPLPRIEDLFAQLSGGNSFTKLDLKDAYCQVQLSEDSRNLVVINTQRGLFRYTRLPFGVASAPAIFQREIDKILQGLKGASCYLDDLLVTGKDNEEHLHNLNEVLMRLQQAGIKLHPAKCEFLKSSVEYLGHRIDKHGLHPVESKVEAIVKAPHPTNEDELRSFIGLVTYYAKFLPNMSTLLAPLYKLLESKQPWIWGAEQKEAFKKVKEILQGSSLLIHFDNNKEVILACDASPYGLGAVLSHATPDGDRPIAFASRSLTKAEKNYSHIEKETLSLVFGVTRFRNYLLGRTFTLLTDHRPLVNLLSEDKPVPAVAAARIQRWALTLSAYAYTIKFRKGNLHGNADACSRLPLKINSADPPVPAESVLLIRHFDDSPVTAHMIEMEISRCPQLNLLRSYIQNRWPKTVAQSLHPFWLVRNELSVENNIILRGSRVFIPPKFRDFVTDELHVAHQGMSAIKAVARSYVWWPGIDQDLESKVRQCIICQENASAPPAKQISWPGPQQPWERIHIDHAGPVEGHMILVIVDAKTKWLEAIPVPSTSSKSTITVLRDLFSKFGLPKSLVSDNGTSFSSAEFFSFLGNNGITHIRTAPYHPNSNGLAERSVRTVKAALKKIEDGPFAERLARFLFNFRNTPSATTRVSPAENMFGRRLRTRLDLLRESKSPTNHEKLRCVPPFQTDDPVWVRHFGRGPRWVAGRVLSSVGNIMFKVKTARGIWTRHQDQIRRRDDKAPTTSFPGEVTSNRDVTDTTALPVFWDPPVLSPQKEVSKEPGDNDQSSLPPPVLSPQCDVHKTNNNPETASQPDLILDSSCATPVSTLRRSKRTKKKPSRLNF